MAGMALLLYPGPVIRGFFLPGDIMRSTTYHTVTETILQVLRAGTPPWVKPWSTVAEIHPCNALSRRPYKGINFLLLSLITDLKGYATPRFLTYLQAQQAGGYVRKGETATPVVYFTVNRPTPAILVEQERQEQEKPVFYRRFFSVFNIDQVEGLPEALRQPIQRSEPEWQACARAESILKSSGAIIRHAPGNQAFYSPCQDWIVLPERAQFPTAEDYYGTALHELVHWTGHDSRLHRQLGKRFEQSAYAMEELVAELGSAFLSAHCRLDGMLHHASYLQTWLRLLEEDSQAIFIAAGKAQSASDYLLGQVGLEEERVEAEAA